MSMPERIFAQVSPRSIGGVSLFDAGSQITAETVPNFFSEESVVNRAVALLQQAGFEVLQISPTTINIAGSQATYEQAFNTQLREEERDVIKPGAMAATATFIESSSSGLPGLISTQGTAFADVIEGVAIEEPRYYMANMFPPPVKYWHLDVPADISLGCNADLAHRTGITGKDVKVAMVDSGHYKHPFFIGRGYRVQSVLLAPGATNPLADESGHGTGESANIFAVAPDIELLPVKMNFANTQAAFDAAVGLNPNIITCSWGSSKRRGPLSAADQTLAASIATAVASGIIVIFSAGNGHWGFPGQHPDVISAGGVYMEPDGTMRASDYASGFMSNIYPNRRVPDLSGLVGMQSNDPNSPGAMYIMLPIEPNDEIDQGLYNGGANHYLSPGATPPYGDETAIDDGWAAFSGTSAAAPQLAGAAALVKQACPRLSPAEVKDVLMRSARDVTQGNCSPNTGANPAIVGPDTATGNGLVDAQKAVLMAKIRCIRIPPIVTIGPRPPITITNPPIAPRPPIPPRPPIAPINPAPQPQDSMAEPPAQGGVPLTQEDIQTLEDMVIRSGLNLDQM
jgi:subtilisin family serine protease